MGVGTQKRMGFLPLQTPHLQLPGPKQAQSSLWSEQTRCTHRYALKGNSTASVTGKL